MKEQQQQSRLAALPQIETLLQEAVLQGPVSSLGRPVVADLVRQELAELRTAALESAGEVPSSGEILNRVEQACRRLEQQRLQVVINGTGILVHTNMGRSPLPREVWRDAAGINCGYSNLELDLETGKRGKRRGLIPLLVAKLTGAEDALVVNNNAAGVFLMLQALAKDREVLVSRGEQVQIGGGFRIPEILELSGARLVEVGTTNITTLEDYRRAFGEETAMVLMVHRSNFAIRGFTRGVSVGELSRVRPGGVLICVDQGSGILDESITGEVSVRSLLKSGADLVSFSGDKVLGGPQSGIVAGRRELIAQLEHHPMMRTFRPGKSTLSLLEATLVDRLNRGGSRICFGVGMGEPSFMDTLKKRGARLLRGMDRRRLRVVPSICTTGGGSLPDEGFPSLSVRLESGASAQQQLQRLRECRPPVIGTISEDRVHLNLATIRDEEVPRLREILQEIIGE